MRTSLAGAHSSSLHSSGDLTAEMRVTRRAGLAEAATEGERAEPTKEPRTAVQLVMVGASPAMAKARNSAL